MFQSVTDDKTLLLKVYRLLIDYNTGGPDIMNTISTWHYAVGDYLTNLAVYKDNVWECFENYSKCYV